MAKRSYGQGSLFRRKGCTRWIAQYYVDGKRITEPTHQISRVEAQKILTARLAAVNRGEPVATVKQLRVRQVWEHRMRYAKGRTVKDAKVRWQRLEPFFANLLAHRVTPELVMQYRAQRAAQPYKGKLPTVATINRELEALRHAYRLAQQDGLLPVVPHIHIEREDNTRTGFVPDAKQDELRREAKELWLRTFLELGLSYGWRKEELLGLTVGRVDFGVNVIRLEVGTTKNKEAREVPMLPTVRTLLQQCCTGKKANGHVLTFSSGRSKGQAVRHPRNAWEHLCVKCGLAHYECRTPGCQQQSSQLGCGKCKPAHRCAECKALRRGKALGRCPQCRTANWRYVGLLVHDLRRTAVRTLRNAGIPEAVAMTITGHKTASCFRRYGIINNDDKVAALAQLQRWQEQQRAIDCKLTVNGAEDDQLASVPVHGKVQ